MSIFPISSLETSIKIFYYLAASSCVRSPFPTPPLTTLCINESRREISSNAVLDEEEVEGREEKEEDGFWRIPSGPIFPQFGENEMLAAGWAAIISRGYAASAMLFSPFCFYGLDKSL